MTYKTGYSLSLEQFDTERVGSLNHHATPIVSTFRTDGGADPDDIVGLTN